MSSSSRRNTVSRSLRLTMPTSLPSASITGEALHPVLGEDAGRARDGGVLGDGDRRLRHERARRGRFRAVPVASAAPPTEQGPRPLDLLGALFDEEIRLGNDAQHVPGLVDDRHRAHVAVRHRHGDLLERGCLPALSRHRCSSCCAPSDGSSPAPLVPARCTSAGQVRRFVRDRLDVGDGRVQQLVRQVRECSGDRERPLQRCRRSPAAIPASCLSHERRSAPGHGPLVPVTKALRLCPATS